MPPALQIDDKHAFTWSCLLSAMENSGKIDFKAVASKHGCTAGAAAQRFWKAKKALTGDGNATKQDTSNADGESDVTNSAQKKRGRPKGKGKTRVGPPTWAKKRKLDDHVPAENEHDGEEEVDLGECSAADDDSEADEKHEQKVKLEVTDE